MAGRIKGITIEIDGNTTKLQKSLKTLDNSLKNTQGNLKDIEKLLKLDPKNTELLTQKQKNLETAIKGTKTRLNELKTAQEGVAEGTDEWDALQREIIDTEQQLQSLEKEYRNFGSVGAQQVAVVGEKFKEIGGKIADVGEKMTKYVTLPIVGAGTAAAKSFADVDKTMQLTNATMGNTAEEASMLNKAMEEAAANSTFGMSDAAQATLNFARAGLNAQQAADALAPAMNLAAGEGGNLDTVSAGLVATLNAFQEDFSEAGHYADVFANACNNSALDVDSLASNMASAGLVFSSAGYSVEDLALYMGVMADNSVEANEAATAISSSFARLVKPPKDAALGMESIGFSIQNLDGTMKSARDIIGELHDKFEGLDEAQQIATASAIFGKNHYDKWLALIKASPKDVDELAEALKETGTTSEMADAMMGGFGGSVEKLKSSLDVLMVSFGRIIAEFVQPLIDKIQGLVDKFNGLDDHTKKIIVTVAGVLAAIGPLLLIGGKLITGIGMLMTFAPFIVGAFSGIILPILGITAAIAAVIAIGVLLYKHWDEIKEQAKATWDGVVLVFNTMKESISESINNLKEKLATIWDNIKTTAVNSFEGLKTAVSTIWDSIKNTITSKIEAAKNTVSNVVEKIKDLFHFQVSIPHIPMPHFSWTWNDLGIIKIPNISVEWFKKAYEQPYMFTNPTVVGNRGFGDGNGAEMVYGKDALMRDITEAMSKANQPINITVQSVLDGKVIGQSVTKYQRSMARAMG